MTFKRIEKVKKCSEGVRISVQGMIVQLHPVTWHPNGIRRELTLCDESDVITIVLFDELCYAMDPYKRLSDEQTYLGAEDPQLSKNAIAFENLEVGSCNCLILKQSSDTLIRYPHISRKKMLEYQRELSKKHRNILLKDPVDSLFNKLADINVDKQPVDVCYYSVKAMVQRFDPPEIDQGYFYNGCPADTCRSGGMMEILPGKFKCKKCQQTYRHQALRFKLSLILDDGSPAPESFWCFIEVSRTPFAPMLDGLANLTTNHNRMEHKQALIEFFSTRKFLFRVEIKRNTEEKGRNIVEFGLSE